ncbi:MAG: cation diffusion facilitator family transporter [Eubacteriales bacterium]
MSEHSRQPGHAHMDSGHHHNDIILSGRKIFWVTLLNAVITAAEIAGGIVSGSLALLSDAVHNFSDTVAVALSYFANKIAQKPEDIRKTYGYKRAEILAAFINASVLTGISIILIFEAVKRFRSPETINGTLMIAVAFIGLAANFVSALLLKKDSHANLNIRSSYLHLLSDAVSSIGVLAGGAAIKLWGVMWIDPLITTLISLYIINETWQVIRKTVDILMQSAAPLDYDAIKKDIELIERVKNIHHIHSWMINENTIYFEAHIDMENMPLSDVDGIYDKIELYLKEHHGISHVTLQAEVDNCCDKGILNCKEE